MKLSTLFEQGQFVVTSEVAPPKGSDVSAMLREAAPLAGVVDAVNVTDNQSAVMRLGSLTAAHFLKQEGFEPVYQLTCRDRNRLALQSDLLSAAALGLENVLCLTGDHVTAGDHKEAKPVYDVDSVQLLEIARGLGEGRDAAGNRLEGRAALCLGAVAHPGIEPQGLQMIKLKKKVRAGAQFIQTQAVFDAEKFARFSEGASSLGVPLLAGILLVKSRAMARFLNERVPGVHVPEEFAAQLGDGSLQERKKTAARLAVQLIRELRPYCAGVHIMPLGWTDLVPEIVAGIR